MEFSHIFQDGIDVVIGSSIEVAIDRKGAELIGMDWKRAGRPVLGMIWRNMEPAPPADGYWRRHAPILFPIVGGIHGNRSTATTGEQVSFPGLHGFFRHRSVELQEAGPVSGGFRLRYLLESDQATREMYPWDFRMEVAYTVRADGLDLQITVSNSDVRPMPFQLGWHPGINLPIEKGTKGDCRIRLPAGRVTRMHNDADCHLTGESEIFDTVPDFRFTEQELQATYMFDCSEVAGKDRFVDISDADGKPSVRVSFPDFPHLGVWSDAGAPFVCIEPWQGMDDRVEQEPFDRKFGIVMLAPGRSDVRRASITLAG